MPAKKSTKNIKTSEKKTSSQKKDISVKKINIAETLTKNSSHRLTEIIHHILKSHTQILVASLSAIIFFSLSIFISYTFFTQSHFTENLPKETQKFAHFNIAKNNLEMFEKSQFFIKSSINSKDFEFLQTIKVPYLTVLELKENEQIKNAFFLENISKSQVQSFFETISTPQEFAELKAQKNTSVENFTLTSGKQLFCSYLKRTLFCAAEKTSVELMTNTRQDKKILALQNVKTDLRNLPKNGAITWFIKSEALAAPFLQAHKQVIKNIYGTINSNINGELLSEIYTTVTQDFFSQTELKNTNNDLSDYFEENTEFFLSGTNFQSQWNNTEDFYTKKSPSYALVLKGILQQKIAQYFGNEIDFYKDILPIFQSNFAFAITNNTQDDITTTNLNFIAETTEKEKIEKILDAFFQERGQFTIEKNEVQLTEDWSMEKIENNEDNITNVSERLGSTRITGYEIAEKPWGVFIAFKGKNVFITSSLESMKDILQRKKENALTITFPHKLKNAHEFGHINFQSLSQTFSFSPFPIPQVELLQGIQSISWESQSFPGAIHLSSKIQLEK